MDAIAQQKAKDRKEAGPDAPSSSTVVPESTDDFIGAERKKRCQKG